ncbi:MAG: BatA and WFA domain-containing protein [Nanoarchaeota archaeon]
MVALENFLLNTAGIFAFLSLIPFILIYLIRPKAKDQTMSSLMFILKSEGKMRQHSFLRYLLRNLLFLMQLLTILMLAGAIAQPYINRAESITAHNTVLVIDSSASMKTRQGSDTRFEQAIEQAKRLLGERNTIISASNTPDLLGKNVPKSEALMILNRLEAYDTSTSLNDAIRFGGEQLSDDGKVFVLSDFIVRDEEELLVTKNLLQSQGIGVEFIDLSGKASNVGIVDLELADTSTVTVKNYDDEAITITIKAGKTAEELTLEPHASQAYSFVTPPGLTKIELDVVDDLEVDNIAYLSAPAEQENYILYIGNEKVPFIEAAIKANPKNHWGYAEPPLVADVSQDIVILGESRPELLLKETIRDIERLVKEGGTVIILANPTLGRHDLKGILPVELGQYTDDTGFPIILPTSYTKDLEFSSVQGYLEATPSDDSSSVFSVGEHSLLATSTRGAGNVVYYGIEDDRSDFKSTPSYPLFWNSLIDEMIGRDSLELLNFATGTMLGDERLLEVGFHKLGKTDIAVNLLDESESAVSKTAQISEMVEGGDRTSSTVKKPWSFETVFIIIAMILILLEFMYLKYRGDF